jgi:hypothetical protein
MNPYSISEFDLRSQLAEVRRELQMRRVVYPKLIGRGQITQDDANRRTAAMEAVAQTLTRLLASEGERKEPRLL